MLIEFSVSNFRSFREKQTLSLVAASRLLKRENVFKPALKNEKFPNLLKVAVIYGPNASGKSNLLRALSVVATICFREPSTSDVPLPIAPFRFDAALTGEPSVFEMHFIQAGVRYQFKLAATSDRIVNERLVAFPDGKEALLYDRQYIGDGAIYTFGPLLTDILSNDLLTVWQKLTPPKLLFIAQATANSSEEASPLRQPFEWLRKSSLSLLDGMEGMTRASQELAQKHKVHAENIAQFLREVDVPISSIRVENVPPKNIGLDSVNRLSNLLPKSEGIPNKTQSTILTHDSALGEAELTFEDQSEGTKNLIGFWLPWVTKEPAGGSRCLLVVDELDSSLHPKIVAALVKKHIQSAQPSQLIFSTHDTHLMETKILRRDQFWITERDANGATQLRSIHDFEGRESEDIEKRYYEGRYRGLPLVKRAL